MLDVVPVSGLCGSRPGQMDLVPLPRGVKIGDGTRQFQRRRHWHARTAATRQQRSREERQAEDQRLEFHPVAEQSNTDVK